MIPVRLLVRKLAPGKSVTEVAENAMVPDTDEELPKSKAKSVTVTAAPLNARKLPIFAV